MTENCDYVTHCGFYRKFGARKSNVWRGLVSFYCHGRGFSLCERRKKYLGNVKGLSDDIMPTGQEVSRAFHSLS